MLYDRCGQHRLAGPNDLVFDRHGGFYFTDFGKMWPRHRDNGGLYYALADGSRIVEVAYPIDPPNGVGLSPDGAVALCRRDRDRPALGLRPRRARRRRRHPFPSPHGGRLVCGLRAISASIPWRVQANGNICIATLRSSCITVVSPNGDVLRQIPTGDPVTTNICFGDNDNRTAFVTLSGTGRLVSMPGPSRASTLPTASLVLSRPHCSEAGLRPDPPRQRPMARTDSRYTVLRVDLGFTGS